MKLIVTITASDWTQDNVDSFIDWLGDEIVMGNMATCDDAEVTDYKVEK